MMLAVVSILERKGIVMTFVHFDAIGIAGCVARRGSGIGTTN